jgi:flavin-dependent dehydrogenase
MDTKRSDFDFDIALIGAGLSGSCAAILAAQSGARVVLLESGVAARHKVCGEFLSPESRVQLQQLGVLEAMLALGAREVGAARVLTSARRSRAIALPRAGLSFSRRALDGLLWARAREVGADGRDQTRVSRLEEDTHGGFAIEANGQTVRARFVICATGRGAKWGRDGDALPTTNGSRSAQTEPSQRAEPKRFLGLKTHLRGAHIEEGEVQMFPFAGGYCGLVEVEDGSFNTCLLVDYARFQGRSPAQLWDELRGENRALAKATEGATPDFDWLATGNVSFDRFAPTREGVLRVGDAAGYIHPLSGDGMAMALRSGELAARSVLHALQWNLAPEEAARSYSLMWRREFASRLKWAARLQPLFTDARVTRVAQSVFDFAPLLSRLAVRRTRGRVTT